MKRNNYFNWNSQIIVVQHQVTTRFEDSYMAITSMISSSAAASVNWQVSSNSLMDVLFNCRLASSLRVYSISPSKHVFGRQSPKLMATPFSGLKQSWFSIYTLKEVRIALIFTVARGIQNWLISRESDSTCWPHDLSPPQWSVAPNNIAFHNVFHVVQCSDIVKIHRIHRNARWRWSTEYLPNFWQLNEIRIE